MSQQEPARQQTALAWGRTSLAAAGFGTAMIRLGVVRHSIPDLLIAVTLLVCGLLLAIRGRVLYRRRTVKPSAPMLRLVAVAAVIVGVIVAVTGAS